MANFLISEASELKNLIKLALIEHENEKNRDKGETLWTVNQVAKRLGKAHATIKKLTTKGVIKTTKDGLITEAAINEYLKKS
ncbi:MAG: helix-turn-helix domain-containing protein [Bacteroidales bacterium]|nr:helix-turn-helix domain-containing protein [Bacteroidales bacterium]